MVVNHHLLTADLAIRQASDNWQEAAVLPPYQRLILDEAHHLEDVSAGAPRPAGDQPRGAPDAGAVRAERPRPGARARVRAVAVGRHAEPREPRCHPAAAGARRWSKRAGRARRCSRGSSRGSPRCRAECSGSRMRSRMIRCGSRDSGPRCTTPCSRFRRLRDAVEIIADRLSAEDLSEKRLALLHRDPRACSGASRPPPKDWARRCSPRRRDRRRCGGSSGPTRGTRTWRSHAVPLDLAPILRETLFDRLKTVVMTSATLAAGGEFDFLEKRTGLSIEPNPVTVKEILPSPFDFTAQCVFGVPTDFPDPRDDELGHDQAVAHVVEELACAPRTAGCSCSSPSHGALRRAASALRAGLGSRWPLLVQGEAPRDQLLRRFRDSGRAILLGTDSFWEGVDVPGRALRALVLCKLPFKVPSEPLTAARLERLAEQGEDGFWSLSAAPRGAQAQAGLRPADPEPVRRRCRGAARPARGGEALRAPDARGTARPRSASSAPGRRCGPGVKISSRSSALERRCSR